MFTERVSSLAAAAVEAADAEDSVDLSSGESGVAALRDPAAAKRVEVLQTLSGQIEKMMPQLISTARKVAVSTSELCRCICIWCVHLRLLMCAACT